MSKEKTYRALARLIEYPVDKEALLADVGEIAGHLGDHDLPATALPFADYLMKSPLGRLQEDYVASFDFNPAKAPYLGHHLYGDNQKKAAYMISLKEQYARYGYAQNGCELPDHLPVLLGFLAHLSSNHEDQARRDFIGESVLPGVKKLLAGGERVQSQWLPLIEAAELVMSSDCQEV
jgi:nitrate reductase molybdenum cofactor assembly chaperone NarJ/NarW